MYLTSKELGRVAGELVDSDDCPDEKFNPEKQVRVCSIDLRVSNFFWRTKRIRGALDLRGHDIFEISPRRFWSKEIVQNGGAIKLRPGEMLLGRTSECIRMPDDLVGKISTRSSYARLGISTACNCDLVNPGYVGHVPLEIINHSPNVVMIPPYLPMCQLFIMRLDGEVEDNYSSDKYNSKYMNDDGGPSQWWRDDLVKRISERDQGNELTAAALSGLRESFDKINDDGLYRLDKLIAKEKFSSSDELISRFSKKEKWGRVRYKTKKYIFCLPAAGLALRSYSIVSDKWNSFSAITDFDIFTFFLSGFSLLLASYYQVAKEPIFYDDID